MSYNLMYYKDNSAPCSQPLSPSAKDQAFKTVFKTVDPDILCVNELVGFSDNSGAQSVLDNVINTDGEIDFTSAAYSNNSFSSITNMIFFDSTRFGLHSQSYISSELGNQSLVRVIDFYRLYYKDPGLGQGADTVFFTVVAAHLKAGQGGSNPNEREDAAQAVMDYLTNEVDDQNVILAGDLNVYGSTEGAYQEFTNYSVAAESFVDPGVAGSWNNNSTYAPLHTQSTHSFGSSCYSGGGLDDRFDFILHSQAIDNGSQKLSYKPNSHQAIGNDGNHFNQNINSGSNSAVTSQVADALFDFSDHLPIVSEFKVELSGIGYAEHAVRKWVEFNNPIGNQLQLKRSEQDLALNIELRDINGRLVKKAGFPAHQPELRINISDLTPGFYLMSVKDQQGGHYTEKLIKTDQ